MNDFRKIKRRVQIRFGLTTGGLLVGGFGLAWSLQAMLHRLPPLLAIVALFLVMFFPVSVFLLWPRAAASDINLVSLGSFLATPDASFAPNQPRTISEQIAAWLSAFAERHGADSILVGVQPGEPHLSDIVFLVGPVSREDMNALSRLGADSVGRVSRREFARRFPSVPKVQRPLYEVVWD